MMNCVVIVLNVVWQFFCQFGNSIFVISCYQICKCGEYGGMCYGIGVNIIGNGFSLCIGDKGECCLLDIFIFGKFGFYCSFGIIVVDYLFFNWFLFELL